jgi:hypothetical protein
MTQEEEQSIRKFMEIGRLIHEYVDLEVAKEREACAQYCDMNSHSPTDMAAILSQAIRARGEA